MSQFEQTVKPFLAESSNNGKPLTDFLQSKSALFVGNSLYEESYWTYISLHSQSTIRYRTTHAVQFAREQGN